MTLVANLYDVENLLYRLDLYSDGDWVEPAANLGLVGLVLLAGAATFAVAHRWEARR